MNHAVGPRGGMNKWNFSFPKQLFFFEALFLKKPMNMLGVRSSDF